VLCALQNKFKFFNEEEWEMKLIKKFLRSAKSKGGYPLIEIAAVVAITATLGAVVVPIAIDKATEGKIAAAKEDTKSIGGAIGAFYKDVGYFPGDTAGMKLVSVTNVASILYSGDSTHIPIAADSVTGWSATSKDHLDNWLVQDKPMAVEKQFIPDSGSALNWKGPYSESFTKKDPWGNDYVVYAQAMYYGTTDKSATLATLPAGGQSVASGEKQYGWILSAGPNAKIDTSVSDKDVKGDDIGYPLYSAEAAH